MNNHFYKSSTKTILAESYNVSLRTLNKWLKPIEHSIGENESTLFTPKQVATIVGLLGEPEYIHLIRA